MDETPYDCTHSGCWYEQQGYQYCYDSAGARCIIQPDSRKAVREAVTCPSCRTEFRGLPDHRGHVKCRCGTYVSVRSESTPRTVYTGDQPESARPGDEWRSGAGTMFYGADHSWHHVSDIWDNAELRRTILAVSGYTVAAEQCAEHMESLASSIRNSDD